MQSCRSMYNKVYCANCGIEGHYVKDCDNPITSFGIIAFKQVHNPEDEIGDLNEELQEIVDNHNVKRDSSYPKLKFLLIQRKDTMGYIDLLRGKYPFDVMRQYNKTRQDMLRIFISETTLKERENLLTKRFTDMWDDLWVNKLSRTYQHERVYADKHFTANFEFIKRVIGETTTTWTNSEFSFPKGRKLLKETNLRCAKREFKEETGYNEFSYNIKGNIFEETFTGTNLVKYTHIYYLGQMSKNIHAPVVDPDNETQTGEVKNLGWFTMNEAFELFRDYDVKKKKVLLDAFEYINAQFV